MFKFETTSLHSNAGLYCKGQQIGGKKDLFQQDGNVRFTPVVVGGVLVAVICLISAVACVFSGISWSQLGQLTTIATNIQDSLEEKRNQPPPPPQWDTEWSRDLQDVTYTNHPWKHYKSSTFCGADTLVDPDATSFADPGTYSPYFVEWTDIIRQYVSVADRVENCPSSVGAGSPCALPTSWHQFPKLDGHSATICGVFCNRFYPTAAYFQISTPTPMTGPTCRCLRKCYAGHPARVGTDVYWRPASGVGPELTPSSPPSPSPS